MSEQKPSQFHTGELAVQKRLGVDEQVGKYSEGFIRPFMPEQHREFYCQLPLVILGLVDTQGFPWALPLTGQPGFIHSPDETTLTFDKLPDLIHSLGLDFQPRQKVGLLGIELETRRRNRMNGVLGTVESDKFMIEVEQSFGNCPQYIQSRNLDWQSNEMALESLKPLAFSTDVDERSKALIEQSDTFFIASRTQDFSADWRSGIDASHRGGMPGFVKVQDNALYFPDFRGNRFFNTLGNIESDGRVGLFFIDFQTGDCLFLAGNACVDWHEETAKQIKGAERIVQVNVQKSIYISGYLSLNSESVEYSPALKRTGVW